MRFVVDFCYLLAAAVVLPWVWLRAGRSGKYRSDWGQRMGRVPELPKVPRRIWVHAVSVGETNAARGLVEAWRQRCPDTEFVISTTTDTGKARAEQVFGDLTVIRYPLDLSVWVRRAMRRVKPTLIVLVELEVWYQFTTQAAAMGIPIGVVNGRLSERSVRRFRLVGPLVRPMFKALTWVGAQDEAYAERFRKVGVAPGAVRVTGSMKWDTAEVTDHIDGSLALGEAMGIDANRPLWVCGSTGPGEERVILEAYRQVRVTQAGLQLAIVPRKPERFDEVAALIEEAGFTCVRRSQCADGTTREPTEMTVLLGDTMGELRKLYSLADIVFVGRTIAAMGGSDMMEVAALAKPTVVGPHTENFADTMRRLREGNGITRIEAEIGEPDVADRLADVVNDLLTDTTAAREMAEASRRVVIANRGATERTLEALLEIMNRAEHRTA